MPTIIVNAFGFCEGRTLAQTACNSSTVAALSRGGFSLSIRDHDRLALSPAGDRMVDVEALDPGDLAGDPHGKVVLRDASGKVLNSFDPCKTCRYASTA
jgi:hypothetical protein